MDYTKPLASLARKSLGQHFLINPDICRRIVGLLDVREGDNILEIGPGPGALSKLLLELPCATLDFIEKDSRFAAELEKSSSENIHIINMDALAFPWRELKGKWKIIGNLPYNVASPLIWDIVSQVSDLQRAVFMIQLEVADRITARPDSRAYGALSVWVQSYVRPKKEFKVSPGSFSPPPKVDSAVVLLLPREARPQRADKLAALLKICFQNRRKQLGTIFKMNSLPTLLEALEHLHIDAGLRPENLAPASFDQLSVYLPDMT